MLNSGGEVLNQLLSVLSGLTSFITPIFVFTVVFNSGLSEHPLNVLSVLQKDWKYFVRLTLVNCIAFPILIWGILEILPLAEAFENGVLIFMICAGAPIVISFVTSAGNESIFATASMIIQIIGSILVIPLLLPLMISNVEINMRVLIANLIQTVAIPLLLGALVLIFLPDLKAKIKPFVNFFQKLTMDIVIYGVLLVNLPNIIQLIGDFAITTGIVLVYLGFGIGYLLERNNPNTAMRETTAFSIGQRNAAIALLIANGNFGNEVVLSTVIVYAIGLYQMKHLTKVLARKKEKAASVEENTLMNENVEFSKDK